MATISEALAIAIQHHQGGRLQLAEQIYQQILRIDPNFSDAHHLLGVIAFQRGNHQIALEFIGRAIELNGKLSPYYSNLGEVYRTLLRIPESISCYRRALELNPADFVAVNNLGTVLVGLGKLSEAIDCFRRALELKPDYPEAHNNLGNVLKDQGRQEEAVACYRRAFELNRRYVDAHSNLLLSLQYCEGVSLATLAEAHSEFERQHTASLGNMALAATNVKERQARLRLGFLSPNLGQHPVAFFLIPLLENLRHEFVDTVCYSDRIAHDGYTKRIQSAASEWRDVFGMSDERLTDQIRADRIDILFDLAGHTGRNRLLVFARKPAPIQITWLGYVGTTGVRAIDYILADRYLIPPEAEPSYCEKVLRMPENYACYGEPGNVPEPGPLPALIHGYVTFGSLNNLAKITPQVVKIWGEILHRVESSRLVIRHRALDDPGTCQRLKGSFANQGIESDRLELIGWNPFETRMDLYSQIDIGLDPFPYSGATTTCDALWMGVPVIACPLDTFASRQSFSHLSNIGLTEMIARNLAEYVEFAVRLANDLPRLATLRSGLRERMAASPLCDSQRFAKNFVALLRDVSAAR